MVDEEYVRNPEKVAWYILKKFFPTFEYLIKTRMRHLIEDINQIGQLTYAYTKTNPDFSRLCYKEIYKLAKVYGLRKLKKGGWEIREIPFSSLEFDD